jgi:hypothetical protein
MSKRDKFDGAARPNDDSFAQRWSQRKLARRQGAEVATTQTKLEPERTPKPEDDDVPVEAVVLPDIESLDEKSDFSAFLRDGVATELRRKALHKLFHLPEFNVLDGLNDYDEDYTKFEKLGDTVTYIQRRWKAIEEEKEAAKRAQDEALAKEQRLTEVSEQLEVQPEAADQDDDLDDADLEG